MCFEYEIISDELTRQCKECKLDLPRSQHNIHEWETGEDALCHGCRELLCKKCIESICTTEKMLFCSHSLERCDICMVDYTLLNKFACKSHRDLTDDEHEAIIAISTSTARSASWMDNPCVQGVGASCAVLAMR